MFSSGRKSVIYLKFLRYRVCCLCSSTNRHNPDFYDVIIVGGGMVGASLACALGTERTLAEQKILLLEAAPDKTFELPRHHSNRVCSITPGSKEFLQSVGAWNDICSMRYKPYRKMHVWDACSDARISFDASKSLDSPTDMGYIVENSVVTAALKTQLRLLDPRVKVVYGARLKSLKLPQSIWHESDSPWTSITLQDGSVLHSRLVIGADGPQSLVRKQAGINHLSWMYGQSAVVATLHLEQATENMVAWQKFLPTGPIAMLPLTENLSSLVWSTTPEHAKTLVSLPEDRFVDAVNNAFWEDLECHPIVEQATKLVHTLASVIQPSQGTWSGTQTPPSVSGVLDKSRAMFPLGLGHATHYVKPRLALVGDSAHRVHPLAGQGVNLGFGDVACLQNVLSEAAEEGKDIGSLDHLMHYETSRQRSVSPMLITTDLLKRLYSTSSMFPVLARSVGLLVTSALTPLKERIVQFAQK